jgi:hypothetical protein
MEPVGVGELHVVPNGRDRTRGDVWSLCRKFGSETQATNSGTGTGRVSWWAVLALESLNRWGQRPCKQHGSAACQHILFTIDLVSDWGAFNVRPRAGMPKRLSVARCERKKIA